MNRVDDKGKVFTERVRKIGVEVEVVTIQGHIHGHLHMRPDQRVKDLLNSGDEQFVAMTAAIIRRTAEVDTLSAPFVAINKEHIVAVIPVDEHKTISLDDLYAL